MGLDRSEQMRRIKGRHTRPELLLRRALWNAGVRYRLHQRVEGCRPDLVLTRFRLAIFVDGCQWHGCPEHYVRPRTRVEFWSDKLLENVHRDLQQTRRLESAGWRVVRIWEHQLWEDTPSIVAGVSAMIAGEKAAEMNEWRVERVEEIDSSTRLERRYMRSLRGSDEVRIVERVRSTRKWSRNLEEQR